jgi:hypothetical protein
LVNNLGVRWNLSGCFENEEEDEHEKEALWERKGTGQFLGSISRREHFQTRVGFATQPKLSNSLLAVEAS